MLQQFDLPSSASETNYQQTCDTTTANPTSGCLSTPFSVKDILNMPQEDYFNSIKREQYPEMQPFWDNSSYLANEPNYNTYNYYSPEMPDNNFNKHVNVYSDLGYNPNFNNQIHFPHFSGAYSATPEEDQSNLCANKEELYTKIESPSKS